MDQIHSRSLAKVVQSLVFRSVVLKPLPWDAIPQLPLLFSGFLAVLFAMEENKVLFSG